MRALAIAILVAGWSLGAHAQPRPAQLSVAARECDRLAANPNDAQRRGPGVAFDLISAKDALQACSQAAKENSEDGVAFYQYGRALERSNRLDEAAMEYETAAQLFHDYSAVGLMFLVLSGKAPSVDEIDMSRLADAAANRSPRIAHILGQTYYLGRLPSHAVGFWKGCADKNPDCLADFGMLTFNGQGGVRKDPVTGAQMILRAQRLGSKRADLLSAEIAQKAIGDMLGGRSDGNSSGSGLQHDGTRYIGKRPSQYGNDN